jgi:sec-independent protein translocase protein TatC
MSTTLRPIGHEERLSLVEHLTELRTRLIISLAAFVVATGFCLWQNHTVLDLMNRPLDRATTSKTAKDPLQEGARFDQKLKRYLQASSSAFTALARSETDEGLRTQLQQLARTATQVAASAPVVTPKRPVTLSVGEPFTATLKVAAMAGGLLALPIILYEAYAFVLPAFSPREREIALPLMLGVPFLFIAGVAFGYFMVLPPALRFLQNFNDDSFNVLIQARDYYSFSILILVVMGLLFQIPVGILATTRLGIITTRQLRHSRRYAILAIAVIAMALPGQDPVTMLMMMLPMYVLYEGSILLSALFDRRERRARAREAAEAEIEAEDEDDAALTPADHND